MKSGPESHVYGTVSQVHACTAKTDRRTRAAPEYRGDQPAWGERPDAKNVVSTKDAEQEILLRTHEQSW